MMAVVRVRESEVVVERPSLIIILKKSIHKELAGCTHSVYTHQIVVLFH